MNQLITEDERRQLLAHGQARAEGQDVDPLPVVRLFTPDAHATWLLVALDPADGDTAYGLIDLGISMPELGQVKLSDLASIVGPRQQPVMRDRYFQAVRPCRNTCFWRRRTVPSWIEPFAPRPNRAH